MFTFTIWFGLWAWLGPRRAQGNDKCDIWGLIRSISFFEIISPHRRGSVSGHFILCQYIWRPQWRAQFCVSCLSIACSCPHPGRPGSRECGDSSGPRALPWRRDAAGPRGPWRPVPSAFGVTVPHHRHERGPVIRAHRAFPPHMGLRASSLDRWLRKREWLRGHRRSPAAGFRS